MTASVYTYDITVSEIAADNATTIDGSSRPTSTATSRKLTGLCGEINTELESLGLTPSNITLGNDANLYEKIRDYIIDEVGAWWHAVNQDELSTYAAAKHERFETFKGDLRRRADRALGVSAPSRASSSVTATSLSSVTRKWNKTTSFQ